MINHIARAKRAWPYLAKRANAGKEPITYKELCDKLGLHHRAAGYFLGVIQKYCKANKFPSLQALVVNKRTRLPGHGYHGSQRTTASHQKEIGKVYSKKWPTKPPKLNT